MKLLATVGAIVLVSATLTGQTVKEPARFADGSIPRVSPLAAAGGDVVLAVAVSSAGIVSDIEVLRSTPPFTADVLAAVKTWKFEPAKDAKRKAVDSRVLVDAVFGSPGGYAPTAGTPPKDISTSDTRVPFPAQTYAPAYPVNARSEGTVLVEASVDAAGHVLAATTVRSAPPFDGPTLDAVRTWTFRPAEGAAGAPPANVYLLFVFRQVVYSAPATPTPIAKP